MVGQVVLDTQMKAVQTQEGKAKTQYIGNGEHLKMVLEFDRKNVFKSFYMGQADSVESTWLAGEEDGKGMMLPTWAERLMHAEVLVMQEKTETTIDYLLHVLPGLSQAQK